MNDKLKNNNRDQEIAEKLRKVAEQTQARSQFAAELEERLRAKRQPKAGRLATFLNQISSTVRWVALVILFGLVLNWSIKSLIPVLQPSTDMTPDGFVCPVTEPNGSRPPDAPSESPYYFGNGNLWTILSHNGKVYMFPEHRQPDGSYGSRWAFWRGVPGPLTIEGHRLDGEAEPLRAEIADGFGDTGIQGVGLFFPTAGCWEVTGRVGEVSLTFVTEVLFDVAPPTPDAVINETSTPVAEDGGFDWRGAKLHLNVPLPESPTEANVYMLRADEQVTIEGARALAERFGIRGEIYTAPNYVFNTNDHVISDGKQSLQVYSQRFFTYTSDIVKNSRNFTGVPNDNAEAIIREFLNGRGFEFPFRVSTSGPAGGYVVEPLAPDSIPMHYEPFTQPVMRITLDDNGEVLSVNASLIDYDSTPVGQYGLITAQEALQILLDDSILTGKMEFFHSPSKPFQEWYRDYPDYQAVTIHGNLNANNPSTDPNKPALILIGGVPVIGNTAGLEDLDYYTFVEATGQYIMEDEIRKFNIESWSTDVESVYISGTLHREGDQIILTSDDGSGKQYQLVDPPADVPLDTEIYISQLSVEGVIRGGKMDWRYIRYYEDVNQSGGGGGGGGTGFYQLNLSGTPVPFPTPTLQPDAVQGLGEYTIKEGDTLNMIAQSFGITVDELMQANGMTEPMIFVGQKLIIPGVPVSSQPTEYVVQENDTLASIALNFRISVDDLMQANGITENLVITGQTLLIPKPDFVEQNVEDLRGFLSIAIHRKADGTESKEYSLVVNQEDSTEFYLLEGPNLSELDDYNALPILVSGTVRPTNRIVMDQHTIPFPNLQFQILRGTQKAEQLDGQTAVVFTTEDGKSYVEFMASTDQLTNSFIGIQGDLIQQEVLIVPDETFGGFPVVRVYQSSVIDENALEMQAQANQIDVIDDSAIPDLPTDYTPPNLIIDKVELMYFVSNPYYQVNDPNYSQRSPYIQPVWHFHGHFDDGYEFDALIQALEQEFLLPEIVPGISPG